MKSAAEVKGGTAVHQEERTLPKSPTWSWIEKNLGSPFRKRVRIFKV